jgi:hypothetical protein
MEPRILQKLRLRKTLRVIRFGPGLFEEYQENETQAQL